MEKINGLIELNQSQKQSIDGGFLWIMTPTVADIAYWYGLYDVAANGFQAGYKQAQLFI